MVRIMKRFIAVILILSGIFLISYPKLKEAYFDYQQKKLIETWNKTMEDLGDYPDEAPEENTSAPIESKKNDYLIEYINSHMEGMLKIDKINIFLPILKGATKTNLDISAASVSGTGNPGDIGNYCISAHRSRSYGRQFNRLNELKKGDKIEIIVKDKTYTYVVSETFLVEAEDTWVMLPQKDKKLLTLITCDYSRKPYPRLIVRANLLESGENI